MMVTLILEAQYIPDGTTVRKITGSVEYTLRKKLIIYGEAQQEIKSENVVFLIGDNINAYPDTKKFAIDLPLREAEEFLAEISANISSQ